MSQRHLVRFFFKEYRALMKNWGTYFALISLGQGLLAATKGEGFRLVHGFLVCIFALIVWFGSLTLLFTICWLYHYCRRKRYR